MESLKGKRIVISGGSRGIGEAIALKAAKEGASIAILAKTDEAHDKLPGTIHSVAKAIEKAGGKALPIKCDIRSDEQTSAAVNQVVEVFGGIDILINNASAIQLTGTLDTPMKRYDLMQDVNTRGTFMLSQLCLPHLIKGNNPHILTLSPPLNMDPKWFKDHVAYTISKYGMSMCVLGMSQEFKKDGVAVNALWPKTGIATAAIYMLGGDPLIQRCRSPEIMADAFYAIVTQPSKTCTGNFFIDEEVLKNKGVSDFDKYKVNTSAKELLPDFFI
jgi:citronellol/citronellal dehydrogenase